MTISKAEKQRVQIERIANGGDGVGYLADGRVVFVPTTLPGEVVDIELTTLKKRFARGSLVELIEASDKRIDAECPYFGACGGCQFWHTDYANELALKTQAATETIARISRLKLPEARIVSAPTDRRYRSRVVFHQKRGFKDKKTGQAHPNRIGFYRAGSNDLLEITDCLITDNSLNEARRALEPAMRDVGDCDIILETAGAGRVVVTLVPERYFGTKLPRSLKEFLSTLQDNPLIRGMRVVGPDEDLVIGDIDVDAGEMLASPPVEGARLISGDFRQSYREMNQVLVREVRAEIERSQAASVLELYSGSGNFSFSMPAQVSRLLGVESSPAAVESASSLAELAELEHLSFQVGDLNHGVGKSVGPEREEFELVLLDPPRAGAAKVCAELAEMSGPKTIVYVSCDPACLGRDLKTLCAGRWSLDSLTMLDMFPRTSHIETIAVLSAD